VSSRRLRITLLVLAVIGIGLASYLTYIHYAGIKPLCGRNGGTCEKVQTSRYSKLGGVPVALIGLIGYVVILGSLLAPEDERSRFATVALTLGGFGFSLYLTYRELFTLKEICEWCVSSAALVTVMLLLSLWRFLRGDDPPATPSLPSHGSAGGTPTAVGSAS
jgi:uncharacterized membrane protein